MRALGQAPENPLEKLSLGDPNLLSLDMKAAADYFGVDVVIGRRDKKSGIKKRKQEEIERQRVFAYA
jgi:DNA (cytosine-5)-methyltransferase 1